MAINLPSSSSDVKTRVKNDVQSKLPLSDPFLKDSWLGALIDGFSERIYDFFVSILRAIEEIFPDTTTLFIDRWAGFYGLTRLAGSITIGDVRFTGINGTTVPIGTVIVDSNGKRYATNEAGATSISPTPSLVGATLTQTGGLATCTLPYVHGFVNGDSIHIDATDNEYDDFGHIITVTAEDAFTFSVDPGAPSPTTLTTLTHGLSEDPITVESLDSVDELIPFMTFMTLESSIVDINDTVTVLFNGIPPTINSETDEQLRSRTLDVIRNPVAHFNVSDITRVAKTISQITRAFVQEATPADGQVTVYVMADNEIVTTPSAAKITEVKNALLLIKPANVSDADLIVAAPTSVPVDFNFSALNPNTASMQAAITENLKQFFATKSEVGTNIIEDAYRAAIFQTVDTTTGQSVISFALTNPSGNIAISSGNIGTLRTLIYP